MGTKFHILEMDADGNKLDKISIQNIQEPSQMAWDGRSLWITSWYRGLVYKVDVEKWECVGAFPSPVSDATGIVWDGEYLWLTGTYSDLYKMKLE